MRRLPTSEIYQRGNRFVARIKNRLIRLISKINNIFSNLYTINNMLCIKFQIYRISCKPNYQNKIIDIIEKE